MPELDVYDAREARASERGSPFNLPGGSARAGTLNFFAPALSPRQGSETDAAYLARLQSQDNQILTFSWTYDWLDGQTNFYGPLTEEAHTYEVLPIVETKLISAPQLPNGQPASYVTTFRNVGATTAKGLQFSLKLPDGSTVPLAAPPFLAAGKEISYSSSYSVPFSPSSGTLTAVASASWSDNAGTAYGPHSATRTVPIARANTPPVVSAGPDLVVTLPAVGNLLGSASDDGLPNGTLSLNWVKEAGPGVVQFANAGAARTQVAFSDRAPAHQEDHGHDAHAAAPAASH